MQMMNNGRTHLFRQLVLSMICAVIQNLTLKLNHLYIYIAIIKKVSRVSGNYALYWVPVSSHRSAVKPIDFFIQTKHNYSIFLTLIW